jgi:hypothetical protein
MPMAELVVQLQKHFNYSETTLYQYLQQMNSIERVSIPNSRKKICRIKEVIENNSYIGTLHERVNRRVYAILESIPSKQILLDDLIKRLLKEFECPKPTLYRYIAELDYLERLDLPNSRKKICRLKSAPISPIVTDNIQKTIDDLITQLRNLPTGDGKAYEKLVKKFLEFAFHEEFGFTPFEVQEQVATYNGKRIRDFIIDNRDSRVEFWKDLKHVRKLEKILFDAKNYKDALVYSEIDSTLRYLEMNKAFGNFIIIISRKGIKDYEEFIEAYSSNDRIILSLDDEELITLINLKRKGVSPSTLIDQKYHEFLSRT